MESIFGADVDLWTDASSTFRKEPVGSRPRCLEEGHRLFVQLAFTKP
jgi:hypothetical protein